MTLAELLADIQSRECPQTLDPDYIGSCPCFVASVKVDGHKVWLEGRCWRVSQYTNPQDLIVAGDLPDEQLRQIGEALKTQLDQQEWYAPYEVSVGYGDDDAPPTRGATDG